MLKYIIKKTKIELNYIKSHIKALRGINKHYLNLNKKYILKCMYLKHMIGCMR